MQNASPSAPAFDFYSLRFDFSAHGPFLFPPVLSANIFRGAFGIMLHRVSPRAYDRIFAPLASSGGPSGLADRPRPFVFRTRHLDGQTIADDDGFHIGLNLFRAQSESDLISHLTEAFTEMGRIGFGPQRSRATLLAISPTAQLFSLPLSPAKDVSQLRVDFLTPTELKSESHTSDTLLFPVLLRRVRDRISTLRALYGAGPLQIDFESLGNRATAVRLTRSEIHHVEASRRSSRTAQVHPLGGFIGFAEYAGDLTEFLPYLQIAAHTGVGRQTVWGKGEIATAILG